MAQYIYFFFQNAVVPFLGIEGTFLFFPRPPGWSAVLLGDPSLPGSAARRGDKSAVIAAAATPDF